MTPDEHLVTAEFYADKAAEAFQLGGLDRAAAAAQLSQAHAAIASAAEAGVPHRRIQQDQAVADAPA